jgi:GST-like protein
MAGQNHHFALYAPEKLPYAIDRYVRETGRLYRVLDHRLADRPYIAGDYSIADIACYPWVTPERQGQDIEEFPHLKRWKADIRARPAVQRAYEMAKALHAKQPVVSDAESRRVLYGQSKDTVK